MTRSPLEFSVKAFDELSLHELHDLLKLRSEVFVVEQQCVYGEIDGKDPEAVHLLGKFGGELAAYGRWYRRDSRIVLGRIVTAAWGRGRGWGRQVMARALEVIGPREIELDAQAHLEDFYAGYGFEARGEPFPDAGILHIKMLRAAEA